MIHRWFLLAVLASGSTFGASVDWQWRGGLSRGQSIEVRGINGNVRAVPSPDGQFEVAARLENGTDAERDVQVQLVEHASGVTVCTVVPGDSGCKLAESGSGPVTRVNYVLSVPAGVSLRASTVNGGVEAESLQSDVEAQTINGKISVSTTGTLQAKAVNGSIEAELLRPFWSKPPDLATVNGGIVLTLPSRSRTNLQAETKNGKIVSELRALRGTITEHKLKASFVGGGSSSPLRVRTINGTIRLRSLNQ